MARTPAQRGPFGRWLTRVREERYEKQSDALEAMRRLAGIHISPSEYAQWEAGSRVPREDNPKRARLYEFFGSRPEEETGPASGGAGLDALVLAIRDQTAAINALVSRLESLAVDAIRDGVAEALEEARAAATGQAAGGSPPARPPEQFV